MVKHPIMIYSIKYTERWSEKLVSERNLLEAGKMGKSKDMTITEKWTHLQKASRKIVYTLWLRELGLKQVYNSSQLGILSF